MTSTSTLSPAGAARLRAVSSSPQLTPRGADLLRRTRDYIVAHPETFDMERWVCGTHACIGGRMMLLLGVHALGYSHADEKLTEYCFDPLPHCAGRFELEPVFDLLNPLHPFRDLFFEYRAADKTVGRAAARINAFLVAHGYEPYPVDADVVLT